MSLEGYNTLADIAAQQAGRLHSHIATMAEVLPAPMLMHFVALVANPRTSSDMLLIIADALREAADADPWPVRGATLARLADELAALAPTRAEPEIPAF